MKINDANKNEKFEGIASGPSRILHNEETFKKYNDLLETFEPERKKAILAKKATDEEKELIGTIFDKPFSERIFLDSEGNKCLKLQTYSEINKKNKTFLVKNEDIDLIINLFTKDGVELIDLPLVINFESEIGKPDVIKEISVAKKK